MFGENFDMDDEKREGNETASLLEFALKGTELQHGIAHPLLSPQMHEQVVDSPYPYTDTPPATAPIVTADERSLVGEGGSEPSTRQVNVTPAVRP